MAPHLGASPCLRDALTLSPSAPHATITKASPALLAHPAAELRPHMDVEAPDQLVTQDEDDDQNEPECPWPTQG